MKSGSLRAAAPAVNGDSDTPTPTAASGADAHPLTAAALQALQTALATEQAALWSYGLVAAHNASVSSQVTDMVREHQSSNNVAVNLLTQAGVNPVEPAAAYSTPITLDDQASAIALARIIESDCAAAWRSVIGHTRDATVRGTALTALTQCALRLVSWRQAAGEQKLTVPFPGQVDHADEPG